MLDSRKDNLTLYLDFDGVLNNDVFLRWQRNHVEPGQYKLFAPSNMEALNRLCRELPVEAIVITSSWREGRSDIELGDLLENENFMHRSLIAGVTPTLQGGRSAEILCHARENGVEQCIILDDEPLQGFSSAVFFKTSSATGLTQALCDFILSARGQVNASVSD